MEKHTNPRKGIGGGRTVTGKSVVLSSLGGKREKPTLPQVKPMRPPLGPRQRPHYFGERRSLVKFNGRKAFSTSGGGGKVAL